MARTPKNSKNNIKQYLAIITCIAIAVILGIFSNDLIIGGSLLVFSLLSSYLAAIYKRSNYIFGALSSLLITYTSFINNYFGSFIINILIFAPLELYGFFVWSRNLDSSKNVKIKSFSFKNSIIVTGSCIVGSIVFGYLLTKIPNQQLAFLDSVICCLDVCALLLLNLRYREAWWVWTFSGVLSTIMWAITLMNGGNNAMMRFFTASCFTIISIYGVIKWNIKTKTENKH